MVKFGLKQRKLSKIAPFSYFKGLVNLQNYFETLNDLNDIDEKTKMLKTPS